MTDYVFPSDYHGTALSGSPVEVQPYPSDDFFHGVVRPAGKLQLILDSTRQPRLYAAQLERGRLRLFHFRQVHFQEVLMVTEEIVGRYNMLCLAGIVRVYRRRCWCQTLTTPDNLTYTW